jgi:DNA-binding MarR family transcriptional regulator
MALNPAPPAQMISGSPLTRLYLREDELVAGIATLFEAAAALKTVGESQRGQADLSWAELRTLLALARRGDTVMGLAHRLSVTKQALARTLEALESAGRIERRADPRDRRRRLTVLTHAGEALVAASTGAMRQRLAQAYRAAGGDSVAGSDRVLGLIARGPDPRGEP